MMANTKSKKKNTKAKPAEQNYGKIIGIATAAIVAVLAALILVVCLIDANKPAYYADIELQNYGVITVKLNSEQSPITTDNFVKLANEGFYDGLTLHRIIAGFMMQGGDPNGNGTGGSAQTIKGEFTANGVNNTQSLTRGAIAMARTGDDFNSASSQFFIVQQDCTELDGQYAVFGYVTEGMEVVDAVCAAARPLDNNGTIAPADQPVITSVKIYKK